MKVEVTVDKVEAEIEVDTTPKPNPEPTVTPESIASENKLLLDDLFTYHKPDEGQIPKYEAIRQQARVMADVIHHCCPPSADRTAAMRQLQDTVMTANRAIALQGRSYR